MAWIVSWWKVVHIHISSEFIPCLQNWVRLCRNFEVDRWQHFLLCLFLSCKLFIEVVDLHGKIVSDIDDIFELVLHAVQAHHLLNEFFYILEDGRVPAYVSRTILLKTLRFIGCSSVVKDTDVIGEEVLALVGASLMDLWCINRRQLIKVNTQYLSTFYGSSAATGLFRGTFSVPTFSRGYSGNSLEMVKELVSGLIDSTEWDTLFWESFKFSWWDVEVLSNFNYSPF